MNPQRKRTLYILFFAFFASKGIYRLLVWMLMQQARQAPTSGTLETMRPFCYGLAAVNILFCIGWMFLRTGPSATWQRFQTNVIVSLALSESCAIFGLLLFLLGGPASEFDRFMIASMVTDLVVVLPFLVRRM